MVVYLREGECEMKCTKCGTKLHKGVKFPGVDSNGSAICPKGGYHKPTKS
jgi:hypothetical protein